MALTVATNTGALMAQAAASSVNKEMEISMERLSTGKRINGASDDAAGVAIASRLSAEIRGTNQAIRNALDAQALIDTAEGAHVEIESILQRMRELAVQSANDTNNSTDRGNLQLELNALTAEINRISAVTKWAGQNLLTGTGGNNSNGTFKMQVGSQNSASDMITASINSMSAASLGVGSGNAVVSPTAASFSKIGGSVLQASGTAVSGDAFTFTLNGESVAVTVGTINGSGDMAYSAVRTHADGTTSAHTGTAILAESGGAGVRGMAAAIAEVINNTTTGLAADDASGGHNGISAVAATDGSVTITQTLSVANASVDNSGASTAAKAASYNQSTNTLTFAAADIASGGAASTSTAATSAIDDATVFTFDVNGETITYTTSDTDKHGMTIGGTVNALQEAFDANTDLLGISATVSESSGAIQIVFSPSVTLGTPSTSNAGSSTALDITSSATSVSAITAIDTAIQTVNSQRASLGAVSNRLDSTVSNLTNISNNLQAGRGRIEDADFAAETTNLAKTQILQQASTAMLAQANAAKQNVLSLLQG
jgi:flagellin